MSVATPAAQAQIIQIGTAKSCKGPGCSDRYDNPRNLGRKNNRQDAKYRANVKAYKPVNRGKYGFKVKYRKYNNIRKRGWGKNRCQQSPRHKYTKLRKIDGKGPRLIGGGLFRRYFVVRRSSDDQICGPRISVRHRDVNTVCQPRFKMKHQNLGKVCTPRVPAIKHRDLNTVCQPKFTMKHRSLDRVCTPRLPAIKHKNFDKFTCGRLVIHHTPNHKYKVPCDPNITAPTTNMEHVANDIKRFFTNKKKFCQLEKVYSGVSTGYPVETEEHGLAIVKKFKIKPKVYKYARWGGDSTDIKIRKRKVNTIKHIMVQVPRDGFFDKIGGLFKGSQFKTVKLSEAESKRIMMEQLMERGKIDWLVRMYPEERPNLQQIKIDYGLYRKPLFLKRMEAEQAKAAEEQARPNAPKALPGD
ncbi:MAG: hypothetical protein ACOCZ8_02035 [Bacteroidota bacterium]